MKTKTAKQPKQAKPTVQLKDIKPKRDARGGVIAVLKGAAKGVQFTGGVRVAASYFGGDNGGSLP